MFIQVTKSLVRFKKFYDILVSPFIRSLAVLFSSLLSLYPPRSFSLAISVKLSTINIDIYSRILQVSWAACVNCETAVSNSPFVSLFLPSLLSFYSPLFILSFLVNRDAVPGISQQRWQVTLFLLLFIDTPANPCSPFFFFFFFSLFSSLISPAPTATHIGRNLLRIILAWLPADEEVRIFLLAMR